MRDVFHDELDGIGAGVAEMIRLVAAAMEGGTAALLDADLSRAERVIDADARVDALRVDLEDRAFQMIARQQPVASDLRLLVTTLHLVSDLERMGDLALHVAKAARRRHPDLVLPQEVAPYFAEMGRVALDLAQDARRVILDRDIELAFTMESDDDAMDDLHRHLFTVMMNKEWPHGVAPAVDVTLLGRFYERFADHAVAVARRVVFMVTGKMPDPPLA
jgi:phosphate transport system protein